MRAGWEAHDGDGVEELQARQVLVQPKVEALAEWGCLDDEEGVGVDVSVGAQGGGRVRMQHAAWWR